MILNPKFELSIIVKTSLIFFTQQEPSSINKISFVLKKLLFLSHELVFFSVHSFILFLFYVPCFHLCKVYICVFCLIADVNAPIRPEFYSFFVHKIYRHTQTHASIVRDYFLPRQDTASVSYVFPYTHSQTSRALFYIFYLFIYFLFYRRKVNTIYRYIFLRYIVTWNLK